MKKKTYNKPLFCGLTHVGQVFSIGWAEKVGKCAVFDFEKKKNDIFRAGKVTNEEPGLKKYLKKNLKKIEFCQTTDEIKKFRNVFLTIDTPLKLNGEPKISLILKSINRLKTYLGKNTNLIITSQVYCGFCDDLKKNILKNRKDINLIYIAETLIMGNALDRFLNPERIIIGFEKKIKFLNNFRKFKCKVFEYTLKQAEMVKIAINLFLFNSVSYANMMDNYCRQFNFKFSDVNESIKSDKRIGVNSYISPSLGISGGHLERDVYTIIKTTNNPTIKKIFFNLKNINNNRIKLLTVKFKELINKKKYKRFIWIGPSYKTNSFSIINSPYLKFYNYLKMHKIKLHTFDSFFDLKDKNYFNKVNKIDKQKFKNALVFFNYSSKDDKKKLEILNKNNFCDVVNINFQTKEKNKFFKY